MTEIATIEMARLVVNIDGQAGELEELIPFNTSEEDVKRIAEEAIRGGLRGMEPREVSFDNYTVDQMAGKNGLENRLLLRYKVAFG
jgi:hypothetical protein